jgi:Resolvase, N terminal domain
VSGLLIGYARVSTDAQDLTAQRDGLQALGVEPERTYVDHGLTGTHRERPGLREALAACRAGDTLVLTKLDRLARSLPDARDIADLWSPRASSFVWSLPRTTESLTSPRGRYGTGWTLAVAPVEGSGARRDPTRRLERGRSISRRTAARGSSASGCWSPAPWWSRHASALAEVRRPRQNSARAATPAPPPSRRCELQSPSLR